MLGSVFAILLACTIFFLKEQPLRAVSFYRGAINPYISEVCKADNSK
ncbi:hypothetical protein XBO1_1300215 [Xenorhabdus bovienii str. oregonense]|uniref:Uncharacterized protein n=1 Tax=Xenorhabdus bovienii str. oregonense TaxID=1398202 RepID=A0A077P456_XENBV|nr:hypothetical protein XBO1_1300215 [Xenorhabdus bovienii str. oregonense]